MLAWESSIGLLAGKDHVPAAGVEQEILAANLADRQWNHRRTLDHQRISGATLSTGSQLTLTNA